MKPIRQVLTIVLGACVLAGLCVRADAGAYEYSGKRKKIYCGIVQLSHLDPTGGVHEVVDNAGDIDTVSKVPYQGPDGKTYYKNLFLVLDSLNSMKPAGWTFENPLALSQDKSDPSYWRVSVRSARNLSRMNLLYLPGAGVKYLDDEARENLRRFVDNGGTLWIDNVGQTSPLKFDDSQPFFIQQLNFATGPSGANIMDGWVSRHHPLLCSPYWLTDVEIANLGMITAGWSRCRCDMGIRSSTDPNEPTSFDVLFNVVDAISPDTGEPMNQPSVVANTYGSGRVVATANGVGRACLLDSPYCLPSLKLAYNIMAYASTWTDIRKNPRHTGSSIDTLGSNKLVEKWTFKEPSGSTSKENAPLIYKDTVFYTAGNTLYALDANGDTHGGAWGPPTPNGAVVIWSWNAPGALSAPTIATMQNPDQNTDSCAPTEAVLVQDDSGTVYVLPAFPINPDYSLMTPIAPIYTAEPESSSSGSSGSNGKWPSPPIYINGWIYALGSDGRINAWNPCKQKWNNQPGRNTAFPANWAMPNPMDKSMSSQPRCGPSFGFIRNASSGAIVGMVYWWTSQTTGSTSSDINDRIWGVPVSVSMDRVRAQKNDGKSCEVVVSHIGWLQAPDPSDPTSAIRMFRADGITPAFTGDLRNYITVDLNTSKEGMVLPGRIRITMKTGDNLPSSPLIYASYSLSYDERVLPQTLSLQIEPTSPPPGGGFEHNPTIVAGTPAMGPDNMLYICGYRQPKYDRDGGSILAYRTDGVTGSSKLKWHYFLHSGADSSYLPGVGVEIPAVVHDPDRGPMINPQPCSSPAVAADKVFVTVSGDAGGPRAALLCFKANPEFVIRIIDAATRSPKSLWRTGGHGHYDIKLWQPNLIAGTTGGVPLMDARPVGNGVSVDYDNGTITFTDFQLTKLAARGSEAWLTNTFSPSLPIWVILDNAVVVPIDWSTWGPGVLGTAPPAASGDSVDLSSWNNLLWYYIPDEPCSGAHSPPVVIGNTVYFITDDGVLYALDVENGESRGRQVKKKLWSREVGTALASPNNTPLSLAGSNGVLLVPSGDGLHAFSNTPTLVADNNRIVKLDGDGEVIWSVDSIAWPATVPTTAGAQMAIKQGPVNKPGRARYASTGEILFANSGANQVCKIDKSGMVGFEGTGGNYVRWIYNKFVDPKHLLRSGQPLSLRGPTDAIMWQEMEPPASTTGGAFTEPGTSVVHCLIADSGNSRILDLVYRVRAGQFVDFENKPITRPGPYIDPDSGFVLPELNWVSKTDSLYERYAFDCLQLVAAPGSNPLRHDIWVACSNYAARGKTLDTAPEGRAGLGGAVVAINYRESRGPGVWDYNTPKSGTITARCDRVTINGTSVPLANPRFIEVIAGTPMSLMICDNYGVYRVALNNSEAPPVVAALLEADYRAIPRKLGNDPTAPDVDPPSIPLQVPLQATCVQVLPTGNWLITNNYAGANTDGTITFGGEVFEYDPDPQTPDQAIPWCSPRLQWIKPAGPGLPDSWKQVTTNTYNLKQPRSAFRQF